MEIPNKHITVTTASEEVKQSVMALLESVTDPEVPVLSVIDLGVVREIVVTPNLQSGGWSILVLVTPTYTG